MSEKQEVSVEDLIKQFYSKPFYLSYSGLSKLLYSPSLFYKHYVLNQKEDLLGSHLIDGKVIHCLLLDNGSFHDQFILSSTSLPGDNTKLVVDRVYTYALENGDSEVNKDLVEYSVKILEILAEIKLHQSLKTDQQRVDKIVTEEAKSYWEFLKIRGNKTLLDAETMQRCNAAVEALRADDKICELLGLFTNEMQNVDIYNEILLFCEQDKAFGLKGVLDNIKVDHDAKIIYVNDLKTTGKTITDFKETVDFYNYWAQMAIYWRLVHYKFHEIIKEDWEIKCTFIVIDKYDQVYPFEVTTSTMQMWQQQLEEKLTEAEWHYREKNYKLPYEFATGLVTL
jgi:hypothetical protein